MRFAVVAGCVVAALVTVAAAQEQRQVYRPGEGVVAPRLVKETKPKYTREAMTAKVQGNVMMDVVVEPDGTVGDVKVTKSLDDTHGLDQEAVKAVKQWKFTPGTKDGKPVPVRVEIEMTFTLRSRDGGL